jgi:L-lysine epsilon oxidase C-terminal domain
MLKEYAFTHIQFTQFEFWAKGSVAGGHNPRWAPLFEVVFKGSSLETFFKQSHTMEEYIAELFRRRPRYAPAFLDMANMARMLGGSFLPGIEIGREGGKPGNWSLYRGGTIYFPDLRFHPQGRTVTHSPGTLTKDLALPWFVDYINCGENFWPTSRPEVVYQQNGLPYSWLSFSDHASDEAALKAYWTKLGFIRRRTNSVTSEDELFEEEALFPRP